MQVAIPHIKMNIALATIGFIFNTGMLIIIHTIDKKYNNIPIVNPIVLFFLLSLEFNISSSELFILLFFPVISSSVDISNNSHNGSILSNSGEL